MSIDIGCQHVHIIKKKHTKMPVFIFFKEDHNRKNNIQIQNYFLKFYFLTELRDDAVLKI